MQKPILGSWNVRLPPSCSALTNTSEDDEIGICLKKAEQYWPWNELAGDDSTERHSSNRPGDEENT